MKITLKALRINRNLTQKQASELLGISLPTYQRWEYNPSKIKKVYREKIAQVFKTPIEMFEWCE